MRKKLRHELAQLASVSFTAQLVLPDDGMYSGGVGEPRSWERKPYN